MPISSHVAQERRGSSPRLARACALLIAMVFPSIATWLYFVAFAGHPAMRVVYVVGKVAQFSFPVVWLLLFEKRWPRLFRGRWAGVGSGLAIGALIGGTVLALYFGVLKGGPLLAGAPLPVPAKLGL